MKFNRNVGIITVSDRASRGIYEDSAGVNLIEYLKNKGFSVVFYAIVEDNFALILEKLNLAYEKLLEGKKAGLILTLGGTGIGKKDFTPEVTEKFVERLLPGIAEMIRNESAKIKKTAYLSRQVAGVRGKVLIVNLSGSKKASIEQFKIIEPILEHVFELLERDQVSCGS